MKQIIFFLSSIFLGISSYAQRPINATKNPKFSDKINSYLSYSIPTITIKEIEKMVDIQFLDTREPEEYNVSHIPNARYIGYKDLDMKVLDKVDKEKPIVLYCSIGYRSEKIGEKLKKKGYKKVYNLYGSIFEWANQGLPLEDINGKETKKIHVYNKNWGKWMENEQYIKVY